MNWLIDAQLPRRLAERLTAQFSPPALVEYSLAGMDYALFVSKYQLELPSKERLRRQIETERRRLEGEQA